MFYIVSKLLSFLLMPAGIITMALLYSFITKNRTKARKIIGATLVFFYIFSNPSLVNELLLWWEVPPKSINSFPKQNIGIILTGGVMNDDKLPLENLFGGNSADRAFQALYLYKNKKIDKILISGGNSLFAGKNVAQECDEIVDFLLIGGVDAKNIFIERHSRNTYENARNSSYILAKHFPNQHVVLITSAFHLRRAKACFSKWGVETSTWGSCYLSHERQLNFTSFVPKEDSLYYSYLLFREWIGYITYALVGYI